MAFSMATVIVLPNLTISNQMPTQKLFKVSALLKCSPVRIACRRRDKYRIKVHKIKFTNHILTHLNKRLKNNKKKRSILKSKKNRLVKKRKNNKPLPITLIHKYKMVNLELEISKAELKWADQQRISLKRKSQKKRKTRQTQVKVRVKMMANKVLIANNFTQNVKSLALFSLVSSF
jgi:hypothetical protein